MPDIEGVPYEATGGPMNQTTAERLATLGREWASAGAAAASEAAEEAAREADRAEAVAASLTPQTLAAGVDLDTLTDAPRVWTTAGQTDWQAQHYPVPAQGTVRVDPLGSHAAARVMTLTALGGRMWVRSRLTTGAWGSWFEVGGDSSAKPVTVTLLGSGSDADTLARDTVAQTAGGTANVPSGFGVGVVETYGINSSAAYLLQRATSSTGRMWLRYKSSTWGAWKEIGAAAASTGGGVVYGAADLDAAKIGDVVAHSGAFTNGPSGMAAGVVTTRSINGNSAFLLQRAEEWTYGSGPQRVWTRRRNAAGWSPWSLVGPVDVSALPTAPTLRPGSGTKVVRVPVTVGHNPASAASVPDQAALRLPLRWNFPVARWRLRVRNIDIRSGASTYQGAPSGDAQITGVWAGRHDGQGGFTAPPVQALGGFTIGSAAETVTPWTATPLPTSADGEVLLSLGYTKTGQHWNQLGTAYTTSDPAAASAQSGAGFTAGLHAPWSIVVEVETWATTPVLASMGDSISVGVGTTRGTVESWLVQYAQPRGIVPILGGSSGDLAGAATDLTAFKWARWLTADAARPDAVVFALGINDFRNGATDQALRDTMTALLPQVTARVPALHLTEITPTTGVPLDDPKEAARLTHNEWRRTLPLGARSCWPFVAAVSADGDNLDADKNQDGLHPNSLGHTALAGALGVMTSPPVMYQTTP